VSENQFAQHHECQDPDRESPDKGTEGSALTHLGSQRFESPTLDHQPHKVVKSDSLISKERGSHAKRSLGANFPIGK
jgi:hypothetical protein